MCEILELLSDWGNKSCPTKRDILSIIGKLQFRSKVIKDGSKFIRRLIELSKKPKPLYNKLKISKQARANRAWRDRRLKFHNCICAFPIPWSMDYL